MTDLLLHFLTVETDPVNTHMLLGWFIITHFKKLCYGSVACQIQAPNLHFHVYKYLMTLSGKSAS